MSSRTSTITENAYVRLRGWGFPQARAATLCKSEADFQGTGALGKQVRARLEVTVRERDAAGTVEPRPDNYGADALGRVRFNYFSDATLRHYVGVGPVTSEVAKYVSRAAKDKKAAKASQPRVLHCSELGGSGHGGRILPPRPLAKPTLAEYARRADLSFDHEVRRREAIGPRQIPLGVFLTGSYQAKLEEAWDRRHIRARAIFTKENSPGLSPEERARLLKRAYVQVMVDERKLDPRQRQRRASEIAKMIDHDAGDPKWRAHCSTPELQRSRSDLPDPDKVTAKAKGKPGRPRSAPPQSSTSLTPEAAQQAAHPFLAGLEPYDVSEFDADHDSDPLNVLDGLEDEGESEDGDAHTTSLRHLQ